MEVHIPLTFILSLARVTCHLTNNITKLMNHITDTSHLSLVWDQEIIFLEFTIPLQGLPRKFYQNKYFYFKSFLLCLTMAFFSFQFRYLHHSFFVFSSEMYNNLFFLAFLKFLCIVLVSFLCFLLDHLPYPFFSSYGATARQKVS